MILVIYFQFRLNIIPEILQKMYHLSTNKLIGLPFYCKMPAILHIYTVRFIYHFPIYSPRFYGSYSTYIYYWSCCTYI